MKRILWVCSFAASIAGCRSADLPVPETRAAQQPTVEARAPRLTLDKVFELSTKLKVSAASFGGWTGDGHEYLATEGQAESSRLVVVDAASAKARPFCDVAHMETALALLPGIKPELAKALAQRKTFDRSKDDTQALFNEEHDLFVYHFDSGKAVRLTSDAADEVGEVFSPDGKWVSFVRDSNLYAVSTAGGDARQLTTDGNKTQLFGRLDWVYQEEVYGRGNFQANWWSPDSQRIAFLALDEREVPEYTIADTRETHPKLEVWRYPKAGDPNPKARLGVVDLASGASRFFDLSEYPADLLIVRVGWSPDSREVIAQLQDRVQTWLELVAGDPASGKLRRLYRDQSPAWTMPSEGPFWLAGGEQFVISSERDGYKHLYLYQRDGKLVHRLTSGTFEVDAVLRVDSKTRSVFYSADRVDVKGSQLFQVSLDGGEPVAITRKAGTHTIAMSNDGAFFVDTFASHASVPVQALFDIDGKLVRRLGGVDDALFAPLGLVAPEFHQPKTRDGFPMEAMLYKPADFDPSKKYPLLCFTYSGPHAPQVLDTFLNFNGLYHQMLVQQGYLVWVCDNRSASGKGLASAASSYKKFGPGELADLEDGLDYLCAKGFVDTSRIGLWGWSYGGYMTAYALTHSKRFKLGIAGAPVTDWRLYDSIYTERYMGLPKENEVGYAAGSVIAAAKDLSGRLLVICGEIDENVHAQNSLQLIAALQKAGKQFDFMLYPGNRHSVIEPDQKRHLYAMMAEYVNTHL